MSSGGSPSKIPWSFPLYLRNALYSNSEWLVSRSFSKQNMRSLRFTRVILCRVNCLVVPTPELPGTAAFEPDPCEWEEQRNQDLVMPQVFQNCSEKTRGVKTMSRRLANSVCYKIRDFTLITILETIVE